jgi:prepilin-type N-terminal cleavage/methylation domain-containing protein
MTAPSKRGFSLIEVIVVVALFGIVAGVGLIVSMESYRASSYHSDRALLVSLLQRARSQAINNLCSSSSCTDGAVHGVHIEADKYVLFEGATYVAGNADNAVFAADTNTTHSFTGDIIFSQLSATTSAQTITLTGQGRASDITISAEGRISWTN